jgi:hypothetical protein
MSFFTINNTNLYNTISESIVHREQELFLYDVNITNYESILAALPQDDWPDHLAQYKNSTLDQVPDEYDAIVNDYQFRDRVRYLIKTERAERNKSFKIYEALIAQLPADQLQSLVMAAQARIAALIAAQSQ